MFDNRRVFFRVVETYDQVFGIVYAGDGECGVHGVTGGGEGGGLGEGAMVFEIFFAAAGEGWAGG